MPRDQRDILDVLKFELDFLKKGGYGRSPREPWRAQLIFEDSPTCMNYDRKQVPRPCSECVLMQFVPPERRAEKVPCRHIPLTQAGETLTDLYLGGTQQEIEDAMADWLRNTIAQLETQRAKETEAKTAAGPQEKIKALGAH
ncbi:MAG: hypothetical protein LAN18_13225 [Acidobacteriia bacterium]|nr:hypothetical protein [Terriglobia bacterium]